MNSDFKDTALAAVEMVTDRAELEQIAVRARNKASARRARSMVRELEPAAGVRLEPAVPDPIDATATPPMAIRSSAGWRYLDSAGIHVMFDLRARPARRGQEMGLVVEPQSPIAAALEYAGVLGTPSARPTRCRARWPS